MLFRSAVYRLSVRQLRQAVQAGIKARLEDKKLAVHVGNVVLEERLEASVVQELAEAGAGPKTRVALAALAESSKTLAPPPDDPPLVAFPPSPTASAQSRVLARARESALSYSARLPDFICMQVTRRWVDTTGLEFWQIRDVVAARVSYFNRQEDYRVVARNGRRVNLKPEQMPGTTSRGEFGTLLAELFEPATQTRFQWSRWTYLSGRWLHVFDFEVLKPLFSLRFEQSKRDYGPFREVYSSVLAPYTGSVFIDAENFSVRRLRRKAEGIPDSFPMQEASQDLEYGDVTLGDGRPYLLPLRAVVRSRWRGAVTAISRNEMEFRMYERYAADSANSFDLPDPLPESQSK